MQLGMIGLGRMGRNMAARIRRAGHEVVGYDKDPAVTDVADLPALVAALDVPRAVWVMLPAGAVTQAAIDELAAAVVQRPLALPLAIPYRQLRIEIAEARARAQVDAVVCRRIAHRQERGHGLVMQYAARLIQLDHVRTGPAGELQLIHS